MVDIRCCAAALLLFVATALSWSAAPVHAVPENLARSQEPRRLLAIGDIHGAYDELVAILKRARLVDEQLRWSGGRAILVQTGDYTDRGTDVRKVMDLLMRLEREARAAGGQVLTLLGNHEVMNLIGDWRDVTPEICATFADARSEQRRQQAWKDVVRVAEAAKKALGENAPPIPTQDEWLGQLPPGCLEYREAMGPRGAYGRWLRDKPIAAVVNGTLFMHAGINPSRPLPRSVEEVVDRARGEIRRLDAYRQLLANRKKGLPFYSLQQLLEVSAAELRTADAAIVAAKAAGQPLTELGLDGALLREAQELLGVATWSVIDPEGPLWYRGFAIGPENTTRADIDRLREHLKLSRIVVGHTPTPDRRVVVRHDTTVVIIDTGMLTRYYKGQPAVLDLTGNGLKAIYLDEEVDLSRSSASKPVELATAKLTPRRLRSTGTPGIGRG
jgi:hypothetical protein